MNLLVVDDIAANRKLLRAVLEAEGHSTCAAADGVEALAVLERESVHGVISDILMPNMNGYTLCREIRVSERHRELPCVLYTGTYDSPADRALAEQVGADGFFTKPTPIEALLRAIADASDCRATTTRSPTVPLEHEVLKHYSATLVQKLEEKKLQLQHVLLELQDAKDFLTSQNANLDRLVRDRTAELVAANDGLTAALASVKELTGLLPICASCKSVRDDQNYWHSVESYLTAHSNARFSHGYCPSCLDKAIAQLDEPEP